MRKNVSFLLIAVFLIVPVSAASSSSTDVEYIQKSSFWTWVAGKGSPLNGIIGNTFGAVCPNSEDGYHHASSYERPIGNWTVESGYYKCICDLCGAEFRAYEKDLQQSYEAQVEELPAQGISSAGKLIWQPTVNDIDYSKFSVSSVVANSTISINELPYFHSTGSSSFISYSSNPDGTGLVFTSSYSTSIFNASSACYLIVPISGSYKVNSITCSYDIVLKDGSRLKDVQSSASVAYVHYSEADQLRLWISFLNLTNNQNYSYGTATVLFPVIEIIPDSSVGGSTGDIYNINSRPTSITGDYGIIGDNGQIIKVEGDKIVNETNNNYYNPATGETHTMSDWSYNYEDRSYTVTTESGDTVSVTYGDENVVIKEGDTTYNIYYLVNGSGSENPDPGPGPDVCDHTWTETGRTEPTCTTAGKVTSICSKCGQNKTEPIPATGHSWVVDRTVQTTYDEEGNLLQQGYTLYSCSVCGEQYKDMEGTGPPGPEGEKSIWEKIGDFFGTIGGGFIDIIDAIAGKLLDALIALAEMLMGKLKTVVETVLSIFDEVPALFGGFLDFLAAIFPFLPPEITTILTFGVIAITFIGILKAVRR